jgi:outer membrane protein, heavy metal efflux system
MTRTPLAAALSIMLSGCAAVSASSRVERERVSEIVAERSGRNVATSIVAPDERALDEQVRAALRDGLTVDEAVEIGLLGNRDLRALYAQLDVARADLVQASLLHNPVADAAAGFPVGGGMVDLTFGVALDVVDVLYVPLRKRVAGARLDEAKLRVAGEVLDFAWRIQTAFYDHQADEQKLEMRRQIADSAAASLELTSRMRAAGNVREIDVAAERVLAEEARLDVRAAEIAVRESRERLNALMGLWGADAGSWRLSSRRLPDPDGPLDEERLESRAVERSLDLAVAERLVVAAGEALGLDRASALLPEVVVGGKAERDGADWEPGPKLTLPIPLFDHGQARVARARAELEQARELHHALAVRVRASARSARDRVDGHRDRALSYRRVLLPARERVLRETERLYDAMQMGPLDVLRAKEQEIETAARYVDSLRDYWMARADLGLILAGRLPPGGAAPATPALEQLPRLPFPALQ